MRCVNRPALLRGAPTSTRYLPAEGQLMRLPRSLSLAPCLLHLLLRHPCQERDP